MGKKKKKVCSHNRETVQSGVGRTDSFIKNFATNMSYQQESLVSSSNLLAFLFWSIPGLPGSAGGRVAI